MRKQFKDCFYDGKIDVHTEETHVLIASEDTNDTAFVHLDKETLGNFIEHLQSVHSNMKEIPPDRDK